MHASIYAICQEGQSFCYVLALCFHEAHIYRALKVWMCRVWETHADLYSNTCHSAFLSILDLGYTTAAFSICDAFFPIISFLSQRQNFFRKSYSLLVTFTDGLVDILFRMPMLQLVMLLLSSLLDINYYNVDIILNTCWIKL